MQLVKSLIISFVCLFVFTVCVQGIPAYNIWQKSTQLNPDTTRGEVLAVMPTPYDEWAKGSNMDIWVQKILLGGVRIDVTYTGETCSWENKTDSGTHCKVASVYRLYYTLWGNRWFLAYAG